MIILIFPPITDQWVVLPSVVQHAFEQLNYKVISYNFENQLLDFPDISDIDSIVYICMDEKIIPNHNSMVFSLIPSNVFDGININYRITYDSQFLIQSILNPKNIVCSMLDVMSVVYNMTKIIRDSKEQNYVSRVYTIGL